MYAKMFMPINNLPRYVYVTIVQQKLLEVSLHIHVPISLHWWESNLSTNREANKYTTSSLILTKQISLY